MITNMALKMNHLIAIKDTQQTYIQMIINSISIQQMQISSSIKKYKSLGLKNTNDDSYIPIFSRIPPDDIVHKCNFCTKSSCYIDMENKYYCWFHRSQLEDKTE